MKSHVYLLAASMACLLSLTACSGGGGSSAPAFPVDPETANELTGADAPNFANADVGPALDRILRSSNSLRVSDVLTRTAQGDFARVNTTCSTATSCVLRAGGVSTRVSLSTLVYGDGGGNAERQAVATHRGVKLAQVRTSDESDGTPFNAVSYGGWLAHSTFFVADHEFTGGDLRGTSLNYGLSVGDATGTNPISRDGSGTWTGVMVGADAGAAAQGHIIQGDAAITIADFSNPRVDVAFTNVYDLDAGSRRDNMTWDDIPLADGDFGKGTDGNSIEGRFYGPNHEEVGGVFERHRVVGAFGAARQ